MSCYIVNDDAIDTIATFAAKNELAKEDPQRIGQKLLNANYASVNFVYNESQKPHDYKYFAVDRQIELLEIIALCDHFDHQLSGVPNYCDTSAGKFIARIRKAAASRIPHNYPWSGYANPARAV